MNAATLTETMGEVLRAKHEHDVARDGYDGGSWGYHGHNFIMAVDRAEREFARALDEYVDGRIAAALAKAQK
jgi:hypothetical protein